MIIREANTGDAGRMIELFKQLDTETSFMIKEPGERLTTEEDQKNIISTFVGSKDQIMAVAEEVGVICGFIVAVAGTARKSRHTAYMVMGVQKAYWRQGIGSALLDFIESWADRSAIHRIEFTVIESNHAARALYKKHGYSEEGVKRDSLHVNGIYVNEIYMGKLIGQPPS